MDAAIFIVAVSYRMIDESRVFDQGAAQLNEIKPLTHDFFYTGNVGTATYVNHLTVARPMKFSCSIRLSVYTSLRDAATFLVYSTRLN